MAGAGSKDAYSKRLQFMVQDLVDLRMSGWLKKAFQSGAKTKDAIRQDAECEQELRQHGEAGVLEMVAGARPQTIAGTKVQWGGTESSQDVNQDKLKVLLQRDEERTPGGLVVALPPGGAGKVIGHGGNTVKLLQAETGARIWVDTEGKRAHISGSAESVSAARRGIAFVLQDSGSPPGLKGGTRKKHLAASATTKDQLSCSDEDTQCTSSGVTSASSDTNSDHELSDWSPATGDKCRALLDRINTWQDDNGYFYKVNPVHPQGGKNWHVFLPDKSFFIISYSEADGVFWWGRDKEYYVHPSEMYGTSEQLTWYRADDWQMKWPACTWTRPSKKKNGDSGSTGVTERLRSARKAS
jgi:hypothetical protein